MLVPVWAQFHGDSPYANSEQSLPVCVRGLPVYAYGERLRPVWRDAPESRT
jgi:hypothetical protein